MDTNSQNNIPSGIEPIDKLLGGLKSGRIYLVHGDAAGKSLFGIQFLIEGLKRGESGALVIRHSFEDFVRRFARLGYDCLEDMYSGRLAVLEYSGDITQIPDLREITPLLRHLEGLWSETKPQRIIFDPVANLVKGEEKDFGRRVSEFSAWAGALGATVVLIANGDNEDIADRFRPFVEESFRFEVKETDDRATRFLAFEKSSAIPDQAIEVDPSRGVFLLGRPQTQGEAPSFFHVVTPPVEQPAPLPAAPRKQAPPLTAELEEITASWLQGFDQAGESAGRVSETHAPGGEKQVEPRKEHAREEERRADSRPTSPLDQINPPAHQAPAAFQSRPQSEGHPDELSDLLDDLAGLASPLDLDELDMPSFLPQAWNRPPEPVTAAPLDPNTRPAESPAQAIDHQASPPEGEPPYEAFDDSTVTARAVEILLTPPENTYELPASTASAPVPVPPQPVKESPAAPSIQPKDFNVLIIDDDQTSCEMMSHALSDYTVEVVHDGVSGLAKLISFKPDLVILDVDLPIIDGFKVLAHIRSSLNMPIIVVSKSRVRASDRVLSSELGADYYLTKPFSVKEMRQKVRQLIARHRGISSWIVTSPPQEAPAAKALAVPEKAEPEQVRQASFQNENHQPARDQFVPYKDFVTHVERNVKIAVENGSSFSIAGCRLPQMTANGGIAALRLLDLIRSLVRDTDLLSTNQRNDLVVLLADADVNGARAFVNRLRDRVIEELSEEPSIWVRSFPDLEEATESRPRSNVINLHRRATDRHENNRGSKRASTEEPDSAGAERYGR
ncbi:MAG TPA: response regulator [Blastocatellia bacterium]|jgi:DNA-binding response OmpR family regulator/KaiC/GvpD/RAD55 family RecA-like ATPase|nr:response regulator [Blastocatellia bacterium]